MTAGIGSRHAVVAAALLAAWFVAFTGARPLNVPDEGRYAEVAREMVVTGDWVTPRLNFVPFLDKPPLFYWMEAAAFAAFGVHTWTARLAPALLAALGCLLVLLAGARLHGWRAGLLSAAVLAVSPYYFGASQYVNHDLAVAVWIAAALAAFAVALTAEQGRARAALVVAGCGAAGLAVLTKGLIGILFPFGLAGLWVLAAGRLARVPWLALGGGLLLLTALVLPWGLAVQAANPDFLHYFFVTQHLHRFAGSGFNNPKGPLFYVWLLLAGLAPWTPILLPAAWRAGRAFARDRSDARADLLLLLWPAAVVAFFSIPESKIAGYVLPALPPLALLLGIWWDEALAAPGGGPARWAWASAGLMAAMGIGLFAVPPLLRGDSELPPGAVAVLAWTGVPATAAAGVALWALRRRRLELALWAHLAFSAAFCTGAMLAVPRVVPAGTGPLAEKLQPLLQAGDRVVAYRRWFYDLPVHLDLRQPIAAVDDWGDPAIERADNWRRELWLGLRQRPEAAAWMLTPARLPALCGGEARCFVVVRRAELEDLRARLPLVPLAESGGAVLLATPAAAPPRSDWR